MNLLNVDPDASLKKPQSADVEEHDVEAVNAKANRELYAKRVKIHPKRVKGRFRAFKWWVMLVTLGIYYITPWLRWDRGEGAPDQAVLIDFPARRFYFFFIEIWPQEIYYVAGLLIMAGVGLFLVTSLVGRAWCGYTCPQTVWTDLFLVVERAIEGDRAARIRLDKASMSAGKAAKRLSKYVAWLLISLATGGAWVFYFADAPTLFVDLFTLQAQPVAYITVAILTFTTFTLGGFMREQVCTYMCPWPRIQGAMMDEESLTVTYREERGEPRAPYRKGESFENRGDCIDCKACVVSCPMGIDIRDGQQLECITCSLCIDACDDVMTRIGRPRGLIDYDSLANAARRARGDHASIRFIRPRTMVYFAVWTLAGLIMLYTLLTRSDIDINVLHDRNPLFTVLSDGRIQNGFAFKVLNKAREERLFQIAASGIDGIRLNLVGGAFDDLSGNPVISAHPDSLQSFRLLVNVPADAIDDDVTDILFELTDLSTGQVASYDSIFRGPDK
ncbi:MAG: cytochrome c oxidase accessory protein CcoG [Rhodospirillales bacterium]